MLQIMVLFNEYKKLEIPNDWANEENMSGKKSSWHVYTKVILIFSCYQTSNEVNLQSLQAKPSDVSGFKKSQLLAFFIGKLTKYSIQ